MSRRLLTVAGLPVYRWLISHHAVPADQPWRTACDACGTKLWPRSCGPRGRCATCGRRVGAPPAAAEVSAGLAAAILWWSPAAGWELAAIAWWTAFALILSFVDLEVHRLPSRLIAAMTAGTAVALATEAATSGQWTRMAAAAAGGITVGVALGLCAFAFPRGLGLGDAQAGIPVGLLLGWWGWRVVLSGVVWTGLIGFVVALILLLTRRATMSSPLPYGPVLFSGALIAALSAIS